jgi:AcrR family transcriptional regulator
MCAPQTAKFRSLGAAVNYSLNDHLTKRTTPVILLGMTEASNRSARRERLLECARRLFARWGFDKTSMDDIARETGVSKGAVYLEFPNKDALFKAVLHREFARYTGDWLRRFEADPGEWSFARMFQHSIGAVNASPLMKALMTRDQRIYGSFLKRDTELLALTISMRSELFSQLQETGAMRDDIAAPVVVYLVSSIGYGLIASDEVIPEDHKVPFDEALRGLGLLLDRGLAPMRTKGRKAARALVVAMVEKMQAALRELDTAGLVGHRAA